jgi:hypothetical protein
MRFPAALVILIILLSAAILAENPSKGVAPSPAESVTVPIALDQGRVVIDVDLLLPGGSTERVRGWVDNGNPDLCINQRVANLLGLSVSCDGQICSGTPKSPDVSLEISVGGMKIALLQAGDGIAGDKIAGEKIKPIKIPAGAPAIGPGMSAEINIPSSVLRKYDVIVNFPDRELTIGLPGHLKFDGVKSKMLVKADGLIQIPSRIENKNYDLGFDLGSSVNVLSEELFDKLSSAHPDWPHMTGAVGPFNRGEMGNETTWKLMRVDRVQYGPLFLTDVAVTEPPKNAISRFEAHPESSAAGLLSSEALLNYRVGLDYAHYTVYFEIARTVKLPDFDVVGLILRPEDDSGFTIAGVADFDGQPSVAGVQAGDHLVAVNDNPVADFTLGQVWSLLQGSPGQERKLTVARAGKQFTVVAKVQHFLGETPPSNDAKGKSKKN